MSTFCYNKIGGNAMNTVGKNKTMRTANEKEVVVKRYLAGESPKKIAQEINSTGKMIREWAYKYQENGIEGLKSKTGKFSKKHEHMGLHQLPFLPKRLHLYSTNMLFHLSDLQ